MTTTRLDITRIVLRAFFLSTSPFENLCSMILRRCLTTVCVIKIYIFIISCRTQFLSFSDMFNSFHYLPYFNIEIFEINGPHLIISLWLLLLSVNESTLLCNFSERCPLIKDVVFETTYPSRLSCSMKCLQDPYCEGINFREDKGMGDVNCQLTHTLPQNHETCSNNVWSFYKVLNPQRI